MKIIYNNFIPFLGFLCINLFGVLFVRKEYADRLNTVTISHERIHSQLMREMLWVFFYLWYIIEWLWRVLFTEDRFSHSAYRNISFEKEAYSNEKDPLYSQERKRYAWVKYF